MARSWWDTLWGVPEKTNANQAKYTGPLPYTSQTEFPVGKSLNDLILKGLSGKDWGFPEGYIDKATSPFIEQLRVNAPKTQREVQDVYSSRGLGRGTAVARDVGEVASQRERDINQLLSSAYQADIAQRKADEQNALGRGQGYSAQEVATRGGASSFGLSKMGAENEANMSNNALTRQYAGDQTGALNRMIATPLAIGTSVATGNPTFALSNFGINSGGYGLEELLAEQKRRQEASPFTKKVTP